VAVLFDEPVEEPMLPVFLVNSLPLVSKSSELKKPPFPTWMVPRSVIDPELEITKEQPTVPAALPTKLALEFDQEEFGPLITTLDPFAVVPLAMTRLPAATKPLVRITVAGPF